MTALTFDAKITVKPSVGEVTSFVAKYFEQVAYDAVEKRGICNIALSGGTTPHALYQRLAYDAASSLVPWEKMQFFFGDERDVPQDNVESNYHTAQRTLLDYVPVHPNSVYAMPADAEDLDLAATEYEQLIRDKLPPDSHGTPQFDLILLGMGTDGHTASLFPYTDAVKEKEKLVISYFVPVLGRNRMTFTFPMINAARNVVVFVTGFDKAEAVATLLNPDDPAREDLPIARINPQGEFIFAIDSAAARYSHFEVQ